VDETPIVLVHGAGWPVASAEALSGVFQALGADPDAAVAIVLAPQTDTLKSVDGSRLVTGTLDRAQYRAVLSPIAVRPALLPAALRGPDRPGGTLPDAAALLAGAVAAGCTVTEVPA
jgi:2-C-methyl-D-erythritol 4-phosphate cytidylyltransferase